MKLKSITAKNFMSFESMELSFNDLRGIVIVEGWNYDDHSASGSGKTALLDTISFLLFGKVPRDIAVTEFVNDKISTGCVVKGDIEMDNGMILHICRTRSPDDTYYTINGSKPIRDTNLIKTQLLLEGVLKLNFNTFTNSIYFTRSQAKFISAKDIDKREILTRILDLSDFDRAYEATTEKSKILSKEFESVNLQVKFAIEKLNIIDKDIKISRDKSEQFENEKKKEIYRKDCLIQTQLNAIADSKKSILALKQRTFEPISLDTIPLPNFSEIEAEQSTIQNKEYQIVNTVLTDPDFSSIEIKKQELCEKIRVKSKLQDKLNELTNDNSFNKKKAAEIGMKILKLKNTLLGDCPNCFQQISGDHLNKERSKLESEQANYLQLTNDVIPLIEKINKGLLQVENFEKELANLGLEKQKIEREHRLAEMALINKRAAIAGEQNRDSERLNVLYKQTQMLMNDYEKQKKDLECRNLSLDQERKDNQNDISRKEMNQITILEQIDQLNEDIILLQQQPNGYKELVDGKLVEAAAIKDELDTFNQHIIKLNHNIEALDILKMSYKNIKYYIFESTIDELNNRVKKYLEPLFLEDIKIEYKYISGKDSDKLKFDTLIIRDGVIKTFEGLSDGEKNRANLATNFALSDIVAMRKANSLNLMILDEVMDGIPQDGRDRVVLLLEQLKIEKETILIVDHSEDVKNILDNKILVHKKNGISEIVLSPQSI